MIKGYIGSYATEESKTLVQFHYDEATGEFLDTGASLTIPDSKYVSLFHGELVALTKQGKAGIARLRKGHKEVEIALEETITSCYVTQDDDYIYTANYHEGHVLIYQKKEGLSLYKKLAIKDKAGCHQVLFYERYMLVPCLLLDTIMVYDKGNDFSFIKEIHFPKGSGPRHGVFDSHQHFYVVSELSNQLFIFHVYKEMEVELETVVDLLEEKQVAASAALRMSNDERFLYISIRDVNQIVVYDILNQKIIQRIFSGGDHPRDIALTPDEKQLFVLNRFSNTLDVFEVKKDGTLSETKHSLHAVEGVSIVFVSQEDTYENK